MPERCFGEYARMRSSKYRQCTNDAVFKLEWVGRPLRDAKLSPREPHKEWSSWTCAHHLSQVVRWALEAMEVEGSSLTVSEYNGS